MKKSILKRVGAVMIASAVMLQTAACNTKIDVKYEANAADYVTLGDYKGITVSVDTQSIENSLIEKKMKSDQETNTTYSEVTRAAQEGDEVNVDFMAYIGGEQADGFCDTDYSLVLGKDKFTVDGFVDALYDMKAGDFKVVTLTISENFEEQPEYSGRKCVFEITMNSVSQPNVPMITDSYVKEYFSCETVDEYRGKVKSEVQEAIDTEINSAKKEAVLKKLQENTQIKGYPDKYMEDKKTELNQSINFYALMQDLSVEEYCSKVFGISFEDYVKKAVAQDLIFQRIIEVENISITEYDYKGNLEEFAESMGYTSKTTFEEKFGKDKIVRAMLLQKAEDVVMSSAVYI